MKNLCQIKDNDLFLFAEDKEIFSWRASSRHISMFLITFLKEIWMIYFF